jgi:hypothetical protein
MYITLIVDTSYMLYICFWKVQGNGLALESEIHTKQHTCRRKQCMAHFFFGSWDVGLFFGFIVKAEATARLRILCIPPLWKFIIRLAWVGLSWVGLVEERCNMDDTKLHFDSDFNSVA